MKLFGVKYTFQALPSGWKRSQNFCRRGSHRPPNPQVDDSGASHPRSTTLWCSIAVKWNLSILYLDYLASMVRQGL